MNVDKRCPDCLVGTCARKGTSGHSRRYTVSRAPEARRHYETRRIRRVPQVWAHIPSMWVRKSQEPVPHRLDLLSGARRLLPSLAIAVSILSDGPCASYTGRGVEFDAEPGPNNDRCVRCGARINAASHGDCARCRAGGMRTAWAWWVYYLSEDYVDDTAWIADFTGARQ